MARHTKTKLIISEAHNVLTEYRPMTVRQIYYRLVSRQVIENKRSQYQAVSRALVAARKEGTIPWHWVEDRLRLPRSVSMWHSVPSFANTAQRAYRRNVWDYQLPYVECWLEKDALSGIFMDVLRPYGVTLNVGRGYDGWSSIHNAALRYDRAGVYVLYFGDFDPSGVDIARSLGSRLGFFGCCPKIEVCALTEDDIYNYDLPPDFTKKTDSRSASFVAKYGDVSVELDALPIEVLQDRIKEEVETIIDLEALEEVRAIEVEEGLRIADALSVLD
jgi:hypothetical protein